MDIVRSAQNTGAMVRLQTSLGLVLALGLAFAAACDTGGGGTGATYPAGGLEPPPPSTTDEEPASPMRPRIVFNQLGTFDGGTFPTYLAHLYGRPLGEAPVRLVEWIEVENPSTEPRSVVVRASLDGYSTPAETILDLAPFEVAGTSLNPVLDLPRLYDIQAPVPATVRIEVRSASDGALLDTVSETVTVASKNTVFWVTRDSQGATVDLRPFVAALVTPHDKENRISSLLTRAAAFSAYGSMLGYQYEGNPGLSYYKESVAPNQCRSARAFYKAGQHVQVDVDVTCFPCINYNAFYGLWDIEAESYVDYRAQLGAWTGTIQVAHEGWYDHVMCNPAENDSPRMFELSTVRGLNEAAQDQLGAIFLALKADGMVYTSVSGDFFEGAQYVKLPGESLLTGSQNCIDGALVFASALEAMGMRPLLVIVPGHAFVGVRIYDSPDAPVWVIETTLVATGSVQDAVAAAWARLIEAAEANQAMIIDVRVARDYGLTPIPL